MDEAGCLRNEACLEILDISPSIELESNNTGRMRARVAKSQLELPSCTWFHGEWGWVGLDDEFGAYLVQGTYRTSKGVQWWSEALRKIRHSVASVYYSAAQSDTAQRKLQEEQKVRLSPEQQHT